MGKFTSRNSFKLIVVLTILALVFGAGAVVAQDPVPATEPGGMSSAQPSPPASGDADGGVVQVDKATLLPAVTDVGGPAQESAQSPAGAAPDANPRGAVDPKSPKPALTFSYYYVSGSTLLPRDSGTGRDYTSTGCSFTVGGTDRIMNTELHIPEGSTIKYLRLFYNDTSATANVQGFLTRYDAGNSTNDLVSVSSSGSAGVGTALSTEITHTVDNFGYAYALIGWPGESSPASQICGLRVAYYAPTAAVSYLPMVLKD